jgi:hypothetical protein
MFDVNALCSGGVILFQVLFAYLQISAFTAYGIIGLLVAGALIALITLIEVTWPPLAIFQSVFQGIVFVSQVIRWLS